MYAITRIRVQSISPSHFPVSRHRGATSSATIVIIPASRHLNNPLVAKKIGVFFVFSFTYRDNREFIISTSDTSHLSRNIIFIQSLNIIRSHNNVEFGVVTVNYKYEYAS